jgi:hypothetical protein
MSARKLNRRKTPRLAYPEYVSKNPDDSIQVKRARLELFRAVKRVCPKFVEKLFADVFPCYVELAKSGFNVEGLVFSQSPLDWLPEGHLKAALFKWAAEFKSDSGWLKADALRTLHGWYVNPKWKQSLTWYPNYTHSASLTGETFLFRSEGWETTLLAWPTYSQSVRQRFEKALLAHEKETRKLAVACGLVRVQLTFSPANFEWFVLHVFAGWSSPKIADQWSSKHQDGVDPSTVLKGIKTIARLIAWDVKKPRSKRNRKVC